MSSTDSQRAPIYIAKWRLLTHQRGRKHMAVFIPNPPHRGVDPSDISNECLGTMIQVQGSPLMGFEHNIKRNWKRQRTENIESFHFLSWIGSQHAPEPATSEFLEADEKPNGYLGRVALTVRPPGVSQPLWDADSIFDCQDWVHDYMTRLSQKHVVDAAVLDVLRALEDPKTALIPRPSSISTPAQPLVTASVVRVSQPTSQLTYGDGPGLSGSKASEEWRRPSLV